MPLILDTYNVLHVTGVLPPELAGIEVPELIDLILGSRYRAEEACLVCDGTPPRRGAAARRTGGVHVVYAGAGRSADRVIEQMIARSSIPKRLTVVSSDRRIMKAARKRRCRVLRSEDFLRQLAGDQLRPGGRRGGDRRPEPPLSKGEVDAWIRLFGLSDDDLESDASDPSPEDLPPIDMRRILGEG